MIIPFGLYIHWPFCLSKCPYCDFNSHVRKEIDEASWCTALLQELKRYRALTPDHYLKTIFFGGGTPSLMDPKTVESIIDAALMLWSHDEAVEISLEANPNSVEVEKFKSLHAAGVNRVSIGIQSLRADDLKKLGRQHSVDDGLRAIEVARNTFDRYSFDLIYAREGQCVEDWQDELTEAISYAGSHLSLYQLTIEPGTQFEKRHQRGDLIIPDEENAFSFYKETQQMMKASGFETYEVSNHAKPGAECQHNLIYWRYQDYIGVGPGAHGRVTINGTKQATRQFRAPETWLKNIHDHGHADEEVTPLTASEVMEERIMMGLRLNEGILMVENEAMLDENRINTLIQEKFLTRTNSRLIATDKGRLCLNSVTGYVLKN